MKNILKTIIVLICMGVILCSCNSRQYSNTEKSTDNMSNTVTVNTKIDDSYKSIAGYKEYISDRDKGEVTSFCGMATILEKNNKARSYYKNNVRKSGNFLITNYLDGICINKVIDITKWDFKIPEQIEGLPVIKLGSYLDNNDCFRPFASLVGVNVKFVMDEGGYKVVRLSKNVKYIEADNLFRYENYIIYSVDKENPYYGTDKELTELYAMENGFVQPAYLENDEL